MGVGDILNKMDREGFSEDLAFEQWSDPSVRLEDSCPDRGVRGVSKCGNDLAVFGQGGEERQSWGKGGIRRADFAAWPGVWGHVLLPAGDTESSKQGSDMI